MAITKGYKVPQFSFKIVGPHDLDAGVAALKVKYPGREKRIDTAAEKIKQLGPTPGISLDDHLISIENGLVRNFQRPPKRLVGPFDESADERRLEQA